MTPDTQTAGLPSGGVIVLLKGLQRVCVRLLLPLMGWRVPVRLLRGAAHSSGDEIKVLVAGDAKVTEHLVQRLFARESAVENGARVPAWALEKHLRRLRADADLTLIGMDHISVRLFLARDYLAVPPRISSWMQVPENVGSLLKGNRKVADDFRRVRQQGFASQISTAAADFDLFYDQFYRPHVLGRHAGMAEVAPRWMLRLAHRFGGIQWLTQNGERVAGGLVIRSGGKIHTLVNGLRAGQEGMLLRHGGTAALYACMVEHAVQMGCTRILLGGSRSSLHDGVLRYKAKWLGGLAPHDGCLSANLDILLCWNRLSGPVAGVLSRTSLIHHEQGGFSALWAFPQDLPLTAENLRQQYSALKLRGLQRFRILLPGPCPEEFVCPPEVRLIELAAVDGAGPQRLMELSP